MEKVWFKNYPEGVPEEISPEEYSSIIDLFQQSVQRYGNQVAYENMGKTLTYREVDILSQNMASYFSNVCHLKKGDRIALQMPNLLQFPVALIGALKAGLIVVNTNPLYTAREMKHQFNDSGAKAIVILSHFAHVLQEIVAETALQHIIITDLADMLDFPKKQIVHFVVKHIKKMIPPYFFPKAKSFSQALNEGAQYKFEIVTTTHEDIAFLQYTGGTTGVAKGAMLTHRNIISNMLQVGEWVKPLLKEGEEIIVTALPLYHIFSLTVNGFCFMRLGAKNILITNPKDIPGFIKNLSQNKFTVFTGVNTLFNALMNHPDFSKIDFSHLKVSVAGGMALQKAVAEGWTRKTKTLILEGFGLTESSPVACCNPPNGKDRVGTIGLPIPSTEVKIIDEHDKELSFHEAGELCLRGPQVMKGYWQREEETQKVLTNDGWLKTGDIAEVDEDGFVKIVDRKKDMILVSGFNVYPNEIEDVVAQHPEVLESAAIGVPDEKSGEVVKLFIVRKPNSTLQESELKTFCKQHLVAYKVPKQIEFREDLPKTNVGKILRRALRT